MSCSLGNGQIWAIGQGIQFWRGNTLNGSLHPWVLPNRIPRPSGSTQSSTGCLLGSSSKTSITSSNRKASGLYGSLRGIEEEHTFNTFDPYDNAVFLHVDDAKDHDIKEALHDMGNFAKDVVAKDHHLRNALKTIGKPFFLTSGDVKVAMHWESLC